MFGNWLRLHFQVASVMWPLWSVTLEEQFYLVWTAFLSKAGQRKRLLYAVAAMLITATIARQLLFGFARAQHSEVFIASRSRARLDPLPLGIAAAVLLWKKQTTLGWSFRPGSMLAGCGFRLVVGHAYRLTRGFMLFGFPATAGGACLTFLSVLGSPFTPRAGDSPRVLIEQVFGHTHVRRF
jgi:peptidoglycan/LPS O-acetylase OafA/YrhL